MDCQFQDGFTYDYVALFQLETSNKYSHTLIILHKSLSGGDRQRAEAHGAEAHGRLDHRQREGLHHPRPRGCRPQEMHF